MVFDNDHQAADTNTNTTFVLSRYSHRRYHHTTGTMANGTHRRIVLIILTLACMSLDVHRTGLGGGARSCVSNLADTHTTAYRSAQHRATIPRPRTAKFPVTPPRKRMYTERPTSVRRTSKRTLLGTYRPPDALTFVLVQWVRVR